MTDRKDFDTIMHEITSGLTGDDRKDIEYLNGQIEKYKEHELKQEIIRACARLIYQRLPEDKKDEFARILRNQTSGTEAALEEVRFNIYKKDYERALQIIEALAEKVESMNAFQDDQVSEYHVFNEWFEEVLYRFREKPAKDLRQAQIPFTSIYGLYGSLLVEMKRYTEAREVLKKGLKWNPISFDLTSEYIETFKMTGDLEEFYILSRDAFKIAFHPNDVARCYRNIGFYFVERELYQEAIGCFLMSMEFQKDSKEAQSELYYISTKTNGKVKEPTLKQMQKIAAKYGFPMGADDDILGLAVTYGRHFMERNDPESARYFLTIAYDLTSNEQLGEMIHKLPAGE